VGHGEPWGGLGWGGERAEGGFPRKQNGVKEELDGGEVPVREGRRGGAGEVQWVARKLARGL
jgi:hypothetical protein